MKSLITFAGLLVAIYVSLCLLMYIGQRSMMYFPTAATGYQDPATPEISFQHADIELRGWVVNPGRQRAIIYYGGNAEPVEFNAPQFQKLFPDYSIYLIQYRGYGGTEGSPSEQALYADALHVYDHIKDQHPEISVFGRSLGSGVATYVAFHRPVARMILVTPFDSMVHLAQLHYGIFPVKYLIKDRYPSAERVNRIEASTLVIVAEHDRIVLEASSDALVARFDPSRIGKVVIRGADHNNVSLQADYERALLKFMPGER